MDYRPEDLADDLGVAASTVGRWERDERVPREDALLNLAKTLGVSPAWLRYGEVVVSSDSGAAAIQDFEEESAARLRNQPKTEDRDARRRKRG